MSFDTLGTRFPRTSLLLVACVALQTAGCGSDEDGAPAGSNAAKSGAQGGVGGIAGSGTNVIGGNGGRSSNGGSAGRGGSSMGGSSTAGTQSMAGTRSMAGTQSMGGTPSRGGTGGTGGPAPEDACEEGSCECNDGKDNDGDGLTDWEYDLGCTSRSDNSEGGNPTGTVEDGWTVFEPGDGARIIYVSSSVGDDSFDGTLPDPDGGNGPKKTLPEALSQLRADSGDWLLLRRGDTFTDSIDIKVSGASAREPVVLSSYGESLARPIVHMPIQIRNVSNVAVAHITFQMENSNGALISLAGVENGVVEGCFIEGDGIAVAGDADHVNRNIAIRRNMLHQANFYFQWAHGLLCEENTLYRPGTDQDQHGMYITRLGNEDIVTRGNMLLMDSPRGYGIMQRPGGLSEGNVVVAATWGGIDMGACNDGDGEPCGAPISVEIRGNLLVEGTDLGGGISGNREYIGPNAILADNIIAHTSVDSQPAVMVGSDGAVLENNIMCDAITQLLSASDVTWRDNLFFGTQDRPLVRADDLPVSPNFAAEDNQFYSRTDANAWFRIPDTVGFDGWQEETGETGSGDRYEFVDPERSIASYNESLGGDSDREAFFQEAVKQARFNWRDEYGAAAVIQYFRDGFEVR